METTFTVDLSQHPEGTPEEHRFYDPIIGRLKSALDKQQRVQARVAELIQPGVVYQLFDTGGDAIGSIGDAQVESFNLDDDTCDDWKPSVDECDTIEQLEEALFDLDVKESILSMISHPAPSTAWDGDPIATYKEWIAEQRGYESTVRASILDQIREDEVERAAEATQCNGYLDRGTGEITHGQGYCPIHLNN